MSYLKLAGISIAIIAMLAGIPHLVSMQGGPDAPEVETSNVSPEEVDRNRLPRTGDKKEAESFPLSGTWKAVYTSGELTGSMITEIRLENEKWVGYAVAYADEFGNTETANDKILEIKKRKGKVWEAVYTLVYENETYKVPSTIQQISETELKISYDYYGYADTEVWTKIER